MSFLKQVIEDFRSLVVNSYKDGVEQTTPHRVVYIDPNELKDEDMSKNVARLRESLEKQYPGITGKPGQPGYTTDENLKNFVEASTTKGPFAIKGQMDGKTIGIVNLQDKSLDHKNEIVPLVLAGIPLEKLRTIPGHDYLWDKAIGIHEGAHLNQPEIDPNLPQQEIDRLVLQHEAEADRAALAYLKDVGREDMIKAWKDYRALGAVHAPEHAVGPYLNDDAPIVVTDSQLNAAKNFKHEMDMAVADKLGITLSEAQQLLDNDPKKYIGTVDGMLSDGSMDKRLAEREIGSVPEIKQYIQDYAGAYRRQVIDKELDPAPKPQRHDPHAAVALPEGIQWVELSTEKPTVQAAVEAANDDSFEVAEIKPEPVPAVFKTGAVVTPVDLDEIKGGKPSIVEGDIKDEIRIGGASASAFFASHARPELAEQRLERIAQLEVPAASVAANDAQYALKA